MNDSSRWSGARAITNTRARRFAFFFGALFILLALFAIITARSSASAKKEDGDAKKAIGSDKESLNLSAEQLKKLDIGAVEQKSFEHAQDLIGIIDFNQDRTLPVYSPYQGRIGAIRVRAGDTVRRGEVLYTVLIPDLAQATVTLVSTAAAFHNADAILKRAQQLRETDSIPLKEYEQNQADQRAAEIAYESARKGMALFGLNEADVARLEESRKVGAEMPVRSPLSGRVTARSAADGLLVQPGAAPAPVTVSDLTTLWMVASVPESQIAAYRIGQLLSVRVPAYPDRTFNARISYVSDTVDPNTHRVSVRAEIPDPRHELKPQMTATFAATLGEADSSAAVPEDAVVREGDGSLTVWRSGEGGLLHRQTVQTGLRQNGWVQITAGLKVGDSIARKNALYLSSLNANAVR